MSITKLLKMNCDVYRKTKTKDDYGAITSTYSDTPTYSGIKCLIQDMSLTKSGNSHLNEIVGNIEKNTFIGFFKADDDILVEDKILCSIFTSEYLYVTKVYGVFNPRLKKISHKEVTLGYESSQ